MAGAGALFTLALFVFLPLLAFAPAKFATAVTFGSLLAMTGMAVLRGPRTTLLGLLERSRLPFTACYLASLALTLYATLSGGGYFLVLGSVCVQVGALAWYAASFLPGGTAGMGLFTTFAARAAASGARGIVGAVSR